MMSGLQNVFTKGVLYGNKLGLEGTDVTEALDEFTKHYIEKK